MAATDDFNKKFPRQTQRFYEKINPLRRAGDFLLEQDVYYALKDSQDKSLQRYENITQNGRRNDY